MLLVAETANTDRPPIGFCIDLLLGGKYAFVKKLALPEGTGKYDIRNKSFKGTGTNTVL